MREERGPLGFQHDVRVSLPIDRLLALAAFTALSGPAALGAPRAEQGDCRVSAPREEHLKAVDPRGELEFAAGGRAVLSGLHWPEDESLSREARARLLERRARPLTVIARGEIDRWGRAHVDAATVGENGGDMTGDLAGTLIAAGLALTDAGESDALCRPDLLALEEAPRRAGRGLWTSPVRDARDGKGLEAAEGDFVLAQGRVLHVGERSRRTYLNFARRGEPGLSVTVPKRTWRIMQERGLTAATLRGRFVRVRGRVEVWRGPVIDIANADMIEVLEGQGAAGDEAPRR